MDPTARALGAEALERPSDESPTGPAVDRATDQTTARLSTGALIRLAAYWLGLAALWAGLSPILAGRLEFENLVASGTEGVALFQMMAVGGLLAIVIQPGVGAISDHTTSRWGRRAPYIVAGSLLDVVFLAGIATSNTVLAIAAFVLLLQVSSNVAQGPYQGFVPDRVPAGQVGAASGLIGLMLVLGNLAGYVVGAAAIASGQYAIATVGLGVLEVAAMIVCVAGSRERAPARPREGRSWASIAFSAWGRDVLRHRSFAWLVLSRLFALTGGAMLINLAPFYLARAFGLGQVEAGMLILVLVGVVAIGTLVSVLPAARLSDRVGRKPVIGLSCVAGAAGLLTCALAPAVGVAVMGAALFGVSSGAFVAVDWALLSELVPRASAGRFMGISNVASGSAGILSVALGGTVMDLVGGATRDGSGPRAALAVGAACFVVGAVVLRRVREPGRG